MIAENILKIVKSNRVKERIRITMKCDVNFPGGESKVRLHKAFDLVLPDRPPIIGGWLAAPEHIITLTGCTPDDYWENPFHWGLRAEKILGSDGLIGIFEPVERDGYRIVDGRVIEQMAETTVADVLKYIENIPDPASLVDDFDEEAAYREFVAEHQSKQAQSGEMLWFQADWIVIPKALWYNEFGYESALITLAQHPDKYRKLIQLSAENGRLRAKVIARAIQEGIHPPVSFTGEDLCGQRGPMVSPRFLRKEYFPLLEYALEPLLEVGTKVIWHCDGDMRKVLDDVLSCGMGGLQGFQRECGMDLEWIVDLKTRDGDPLIIFGPMSVTKTLPHGTPDDVRAEDQWAMDTCRDKASLVYFTSNTITPDTPLENIRALWQTVQKSQW